MVEGTLDNPADATAEEIAEMFKLPVDVVQLILAYVCRQRRFAPTETTDR